MSSALQEIRFGSDGYRGIIGAQFTRAVLERIILAVADYLQEQDPPFGGPLPVCFDTRFESELFAHYSAGLLAAEGISSKVSDRPCPSPYLSFAARAFDAPVGLQITASHNPSMYNGVKLKGRHGGSLLPSQVRRIEQLIAVQDPQRLGRHSLQPRRQHEARFSLDSEYEAALLSAASVSGASRLRIAVDYMHGTGAGIYDDILSRRFKIAARLRTAPDPLFGGMKPEPLQANLRALSKQVLYEGQGCIGIAFDGDGDRLAVIDENGRWLETHEIFCILLEQLLHKRGANGGTVVRTVSFSRIVDRLAASHALRVIEVPVGYKNVSEAMIEHNALMGGEESGGTGFGHYLPERDALLMALIFLDAVEQAGQPVYEMVDSLYERFGRQSFLHKDVRLPQGSNPAELRVRVAQLATLESIAGEDVQLRSDLDGVKLVTASGWVLCRPSGTEPLLRVYSEADSEERAAELAQAAIEFVQGG